jgi:hypothetical protein
MKKDMATAMLFLHKKGIVERFERRKKAA